mmetsp:Transcript_24620/g.67202  ORF Transcript_24620/g.67202 Transcript_24620/m.67202 type:complete len:206 (+) Transcript_24620:205-822(+)
MPLFRMQGPPRTRATTSASDAAARAHRMRHGAALTTLVYGRCQAKPRRRCWMAMLTVPQRPTCCSIVAWTAWMRPPRSRRLRRLRGAASPRASSRRPCLLSSRTRPCWAAAAALACLRRSLHAGRRRSHHPALAVLAAASAAGVAAGSSESGAAARSSVWSWRRRLRLHLGLRRAIAAGWPAVGALLVAALAHAVLGRLGGIGSL